MHPRAQSTFRFSCLYCGLLLLGQFCPSFAQERPTVGVALSGGGAKGFAHIGVLKVLEEVGLPIDYIAGTSMGSIVGGLYAIGYSAADLEDIVLKIDWDDMLTDRATRRSLTMEQKQWDGRYLLALPIRDGKIHLPSGVVGGHKISRLLSQLTQPVHNIRDFSDFAIPYAAVATDIVTGKAVTLTSGFLPDAMRASMAIPSIFTPVKIGDYLLVDGGLVRNLPAQDVHDMGADIVVGVDVSQSVRKQEELTSFLDIVYQATTLMAGTAEQRQLCDLLLRPDVEDMSIFSFDNVRRTIDRGEQAAREKLPQLKALADSLTRMTNHVARTELTRTDSIFVSRLGFEGLRHVPREVLLGEIDLTPPAWLSTYELQQMIDGIHSTERFERVSYEVVPDSAGFALIIRVVEQSEDQLRFSLRFDNDNNASVLLNTIFRNVVNYDSYINLDLILGEQIQLDGRYFIRTGSQPHLGLQTRLNYNDTFLDIFNDEDREGRLDLKSMMAELLLGTFSSTRVVAGAGLRAEFADISTQIGAVDSLLFDETVLSAFSLFWFDTQDRAYFPTRGLSFYMRNEIATTRFNSDVSFTRHLLRLRGFLPLHHHLTLSADLLAGFSTGAMPPIHYHLTLGGLDTAVELPQQAQSRVSFLGTKPQEFRGIHAQFVQIGVQYEFMQDTFLLLRANAGNTFADWRFDFSPSRFVSGIGATLGTRTLLGPIEFSIMGGSRHDFLTHLNIGFKF